MTRLRELVTTTPLATLGCVGVCSVVYLYQIVDAPELTNYTLCARNVLYNKEYYRIVSSGLFHGSMMHIGMNMMSTLAIGRLLEKTYGTLQLAMSVLWGLLLVPTLELCAAYLLNTIFHYDHLMYQHSVGFSGVVFQLSVLEANLNPHGSRSVFGFVKVSSKAYPWVLLVALQFILPHVSFWGHLCGILVGTLQLKGCFRHLVPSTKMLRQMEQWPLAVRYITQRPNYIAVPATSNVIGGGGGEDASSSSIQVCASILGVAYMMGNFLRNVGQTLQYIVMGGTPGINNNMNQDHSDGAANMNNIMEQPQQQHSPARLPDEEDDIELQAALLRSMERDDE